MQTSLIINSTKNGKAVQKTVTYVNPSASNANLAAFGQKITALSTNTYVNTERVNKIVCDDESGGSEEG